MEEARQKKWLFDETNQEERFVFGNYKSMPNAQNLLWKLGACYQSVHKMWSFPPGVMDVDNKYNKAAEELNLHVTPKKKRRVAVQSDSD